MVLVRCMRGITVSQPRLEGNVKELQCRELPSFR
jgi:hypothetical protein